MDTITIEHEGSTYTADIEDDGRIAIRRDGEWAGYGRLFDGRIEDCADAARCDTWITSLDEEIAAEVLEDRADARLCEAALAVEAWDPDGGNIEDLRDLIREAVRLHGVLREVRDGQIDLGAYLNTSGLPSAEIPEDIDTTYPVWAMDARGHCLVGDTMDAIEHIDDVRAHQLGAARATMDEGRQLRDMVNGFREALEVYRESLDDQYLRDQMREYIDGIAVQGCQLAEWVGRVPASGGNNGRS